jgi:hypothetical protein
MSESLEDIIARLQDALECDPFEEQFAALVASWRERGEALRKARGWFIDIADNTSDPHEPVADNGATVWDAVRDFANQRANDIDAALKDKP